MAPEALRPAEECPEYGHNENSIGYGHASGSSGACTDARAVHRSWPPGAAVALRARAERDSRWLYWPGQWYLGRTRCDGVLRRCHTSDFCQALHQELKRARRHAHAAGGRSHRTPELHPMTSALAELRQFILLLRRHGRVRYRNEAGPCAFELQRALQPDGDRCDLIAPVLIRRRPGIASRRTAETPAIWRPCIGQGRRRRCTSRPSRSRPHGTCSGAARTSEPTCCGRGIACRSSCCATGDVQPAERLAESGGIPIRSASESYASASTVIDQYLLA